tara:strand:- start:309 stop:1358 length:1050 start_codon:yes stop_codon:yes gene_type:complete
MYKYYTRPCNFFFGKSSIIKINNKRSLPLNGNKLISFDSIEIITRSNKKIININKIGSLKKELKIKIKNDLKNIIKKKKFNKFKFSTSPILMGILNMTPDSFSDGGKYNKTGLAYTRIKKMVKLGCSIIDIGGESTRPGSKEVNEIIEWKRVSGILKKIRRHKYFVSLDTRKSTVMKKAIKNNICMINDISGLNYDLNTINILKKSKIPFVIHHSKGLPKNMQIKPKYKNIILDIYDFFEERIKYIRSNGINHNNIILDPGIGFGKDLKHNITLMRNISIFHSLGFPIMLGSSRKRFIKDLSGVNDSEQRIGGTISSSLYAIMQGVQILRVHDVNEVNQSIKVFNSLKF